MKKITRRTIVTATWSRAEKTYPALIIDGPTRAEGLLLVRVAVYGCPPEQPVRVLAGAHQLCDGTPAAFLGLCAWKAEPYGGVSVALDGFEGDRFVVAAQFQQDVETQYGKLPYER